MYNTLDTGIKLITVNTRNRQESNIDRLIGSRALRRGYVTEALNAGTRVDMTIDVLDKHYDHATKEEKMKRREDYLMDI